MRLVLLTGIVLLALAATFTLGRGPGGAAPNAGPGATSSAGSAEVEPVEPRIVATPVDEGRSELPVAETGSSASAAAGTPETETLLLEVIDGRTNAPAADVLLRYAIAEQPLESKCLARSVRLSAPKTRTDALGVARLTVPRAKGVEVVAHAGFVGEAAYAARAPDEAGERRERLVLLPDWDLAVEVLDDLHQPASGVLLRLSSNVLGRRAADGVFTGKDGRTTFREAGHELEHAPGRVLRLQTALPLAETREVSVEREPRPGEPVRLQLPPLGSVEVEALAADGSALANGTQVTLRVQRPGAALDSPIFPRAFAPRVARPVRSGRVVFERVPLGQELELSAEREPERARTVVTGPQHSGERVQATLRLGLEGALLVFRALDPAGKPITTRLIANVCTGTGEWWWCQSSRSEDPRGTFEVELEPALNEGDRRVLEVRAHGRDLSTSVDLGRAFPRGRTDMGDVVLEPGRLALVAEGRVVDAERRPVAGASVAWMLTPEAITPASFAGLGDSEPSETDAAGRFSLRGLVDSGRVSVWAHRAGMRCDPVEVPVGARGLEIVLLGTGGLAGRVLLDPGVPLEHVLRVDGGARWHDAKLGPDGSFEVRGLRAGKHTLSVATDDAVLLELPDAVVAPGEVTRDPRIQDVDLRGRLHVFRIRLAPPSPHVFPTWSLSWSASGTHAAEHTKRRQSLGDEEILVVTTLGRIDATLRVEGYRVERLVDLASETEVHLRPGYPLRLALPAGARLPQPPLFLGVALGGATVDARGDVSFFDERGEALVHASEAGDAGVHWVLEQRHRNGGGQRPLEDPSAPTLVVADRAEEQRIELAITPEGLAALLGSR